MATWGGQDGTIIATRFQKTFIKDYLDLSGRLDVRNYDVSLNNRLFVMNDASFMGNVYVDGGFTTTNIFVANGDVSLNKRLYVRYDASFMGNVYVDKLLNVNMGFTTNGDVSLNSNVSVVKDIVSNGSMSIGRDLIVTGDLTIQNYTNQDIINTTTTSYQLVVSEDLSLNGRLCVSNDVSLNGNLFVAGDISFNGNIRGSIQYLNDMSIRSVTLGIRNSVYNTIVGYQALQNNTSGQYNTAVGSQTLLANTTGSHNTAIGSLTLDSNTSGQYNTAVGIETLNFNTTGSGNTAFGGSAGSLGAANTTGSYNTWIGTQSQSNANNYNNSTIISPYQQVITGSDQLLIGRLGFENVVIPRIERHLAQPIIIRNATSAQTQTIATSTDTTILFPTSVYDNGYTGLSYDNGTGFFTNNSTYTVNVLVSACVNLPGNVTGMRSTWIETTNNSTYVGIATAYRVNMVFTRGISNTCSQHVSSIFPLAPSASVCFRLWQNSGDNMVLNNTDVTNYPTTITIRAF